MVYDRKGGLFARAGQFAEEMLLLDLPLGEGECRRPKPAPACGRKGEVPAARRVHITSALAAQRRPLPHPAEVTPRPTPEEEAYRALVLGTSDYVRKSGFRGVVIGLSGGVDSSLVAAIAVDAIGRDQVSGIFMPSPYTSRESREDAYGLAENLGIAIREIPIRGIMESYEDLLAPHFRGREKDTTEENLQARIRGNLLMAFSNKFGWLVLTTGNKSEMSVGYATLYGDMAGGFAVIKDVSKTLVYELCRWRNSSGRGEVIPARVLWKEPTAELKPGQKDTDSLPPYDMLDPILKAYIEDELSFSEILKLGCTTRQTEKVISMVDRSEYKRRQSPPGIKITGRAFGRDWRFPITNKYRSY
jgi:NAD+ synthase (glutamine-hydrolysing)